jgi:hypothetical protein
LYDNNGRLIRLIRRIRGDGGWAHFGNFFDAVRSWRTDGLAAPVDIGCTSTSTRHYANKFPLTLGGWLVPDLVRGKITRMPGADLATLERTRFFAK